MWKNESSTLSFFVLPDLASPKRTRPSSGSNSAKKPRRDGVLKQRLFAVSVMRNGERRSRYRPRNIDTQRSMRWPGLETAFLLLKQSIGAQHHLELDAGANGGKSRDDGADAQLSCNVEPDAEPRGNLSHDPKQPADARPNGAEPTVA